MEIRLQHVTKQFNPHAGVFDVSLQVESGQVMGYIGANGAGKTTTIRQIMGFVRPDSGSISVGGVDCWKDPTRAKANLGYLPGEVNLPLELKPREFLRMQAHMHGEAHTNLRRSRDLIDRFELAVDTPIRHMSKGMKQKLAIVAVFMCNPQVLVLDEPSTGLDPLMQDELIAVIDECKREGCTVLLSSHIFEEISKVADRICVLKAGRVTANFSLQEARDRLRHYLLVRFRDNPDDSKWGMCRSEDGLYRIPIEQEDAAGLLGELGRYDISYLSTDSDDLETLLKKYY